MLEHRTLLTAYVVDTLGDVVAADGKVSLREAVQAANTNVAVNEATAGQGGSIVDTISFHTSLGGGTIALSGTRLDITGALTIVGLGPSGLHISGNNSSQIFFVSETATFTIRELTLTNGNANGSDANTQSGGAIYNLGSLVLEDASVFNSRSSFHAGAIYNGGTLAIEGGTISSNTGIFGGAIYNANGASLTLDGTTVSANNGSHSGAVDNMGTLTVTETLFQWNRGPFGGAIRNSGTATIVGGTLRSNSSTYGGAIHNSGVLAVENAELSGNVAESTGGAIYGGGTISVSGSTFSTNASGWMAGAIRSSGTLRLINSTLSGNSAERDGGGLQVSNGTATLRNVTIFGNQADSDGNNSGTGGGVHIGIGSATFYNTLVARNSRGLGALGDDLSGNVTVASSHNLISDAGTSGGLINGVSGNIVGVDWTTFIDPVLQNNGGPTLTHALIPDSIAVNAGDNTLARGLNGHLLLTDQRGVGFARVRGMVVDVGAFESPNVLPVARSDGFTTDDSSVLTGDVFADNGAGADFDLDGDPLTVTAVNGDPTAMGQQITLASGALLVVNANGTFTYDPNGAFVRLQDGQTATESFDYALSDGLGGTSTATVHILLHGENFAPTAASDAFSVAEYGVVSGNLTTNDLDPDGDSLTVSAVNSDALAVGPQITLASGALLTINADSTFLYDPNGAFLRLRHGETATDSFTYTISDGFGGTATATVMITVTGGGREADLVGYFGGEWRVGVSNGSGFDSSNWASWKNSAWSALGQGDFNGDGLTDVIGLLHGSWWVGTSNGSRFVTSQWGGWSDLDWKDVTVGDLNGDGKDDVLARIGGSWWAALSNGTSFDQPTRWTGWRDAAWQGVALVDLDGDGKDDLLGNLNGAWWAALSSGSGFAGATHWGNWTTSAIDVMGTFDVNGDGHADVYGFSRGRWYVGVSNGSAFTISHRATWKDADWKDAVVGDFDGDGCDDLAARLAGEWWVNLSDATGSAGATSRWAIWKDIAWQSVTVGDFDGDGRDDIAARAGGQWWVAASTGSSFSTSLWGTWQDAAWKAVAASHVTPLPIASAVSASTLTDKPSRAMLASEHDRHAQFWSSATEDDELAAALLAV